MLDPSSLSSRDFATAVDELTSKQKQLLRLAAAGHSTKAMLRLGVTLREGTIDNYLSAATKALGARDRRHAGALLIEFEQGTSQLSQLRSPGLSEASNSAIFDVSEPQPDAPSMRDEQDTDALVPQPIAPTRLVALGESIKGSMPLKVALSIALAIGVVIVFAGVGSIASQLQVTLERAQRNGGR